MNRYRNIKKRIICLKGGCKRTSSPISNRGRPPKRKSFGNATKVRQEEKSKEMENGMREKCNGLMASYMLNIKNRIGQQLKAKLIYRVNTSTASIKTRQMCRLSYHCYTEDDDIAEYEQLLDLFPVIWRKFIHGTNETMEDDLTHTDLSPGEYGKALHVHDEGNESDCVAKHEKLRINLGKLCDEWCEELRPEQGEQVHGLILSWCNNTDHFLPEDDIMFFIDKHYRCFQGLRTLRMRIVEYQQTLLVMRHLETTNMDALELQLYIENSRIPQTLKDDIWNYFGATERSEAHCEESVDKAYGQITKKYRRELESKMDIYCDMCNMLSMKSDFKKWPMSKIQSDWVAKGYMCDCNGKSECIACDKEYYNCCRICTRQILKGQMPKLATVNGLHFESTPECLAKLNAIELLLIKKARVLQTIVNLKDVGSRKTGMRGCGGAMVVVPSTPESTVLEVVRNLPSANHMKIVVHSTWQKTYIVSMKKVIDALVWLKWNNAEYENVKINKEFRLILNEDVFFDDCEGSQKDVDKLITTTDKSCDLMLSTVEDVQPIQSVNQPTGLEGTGLQQYQLKATKYQPLFKEDPKADILAFTELFPTGRFGIQYDRTKKLQASQYIRSVLLNKNRNLVGNIFYLSYQFALKLQRAIASSQGIQARMKQGTSTKTFDLSDPEVIKSLSTVFRKIRGFRQFWKTVKNRLQFHCLMYGPPTFFLTLNPNERNWTDLHELYERITGRRVSSDTIRSEIEKDPVPFSRYWQIRVKAFFKNVILSPNGPLGDIIHWFRRVEYQHRGTQHVHCLLWAKNRPATDAPSSEIREFIDTYITARKPSTEEGSLSKLVKECQQHFPNHSGTCRRVKRYAGKTFTTCRFGFPRSIRTRTAVNLEHKHSNRSYEVRRRPGEEYINDYNPALLLGWQGNIDLQFVADDKDVLGYVTAYSTKGEIAKKMSEAKTKITSKSKAIYQLGIDEINSREVGGPEMADELLGHASFEFDQGDIWIPTEHIDTRPRLLKPKKLITSDDDAVHASNMLDSYYPNRGNRLESYCLFNVAINFYAKSVNKGENVVDEVEDESEYSEGIVDGNKNVSGYHSACRMSPMYAHCDMKIGEMVMVKNIPTALIREKQKVGRFYVPQVDEEDVVKFEDFYRRLCLLFIPWRCEATMLQDSGYATFFEMFQEHMAGLKKTSPEAFVDLEKIVNLLREMKHDIKTKREKMKKLHEAIDDIHVVQNVEELSVKKRVVNERIHKDNLKLMNEEQHSIYKHVLNTITQCSNKSGKPLKLFVSGTAGVGKSFVINLLANQLTLMYGNTTPAVLIGAPTGLAAISIEGLTLHSLFGIKVINGEEAPYEPLEGTNLNERKNTFKNVKLIIIDEISMCGAAMFAKIRNRLREIGDSTEEFGGFNIIAFGDLLQLPPVKARPVFEGLEPHQTRKIFGGLPCSVNFWHSFEFFELTKNMRQKEDCKYAELLGRMRIGKLTTDDKSHLNSRLIFHGSDRDEQLEAAANLYMALIKKDRFAIGLFPTRDDVGKFNSVILSKLGVDTITVHAEDRHMGMRKVSTRRIRPWQRKEFSIEENTRKATKTKGGQVPVAGGLLLSLNIAIDTRVMLRRNIAAERGLVNGMTGIIRSLKRIGSEIDEIGIEFDRIPDELIWIRRCFAIYDLPSGERRSRSQFPIELAFAATIHKSQGLTLNNVILSTRDIFAASQFYVGCSRVRNISGLHMIDANYDKVIVNSEAAREYSRLRELTLGSPVSGALPTDNGEEDEYGQEEDYMQIDEKPHDFVNKTPFNIQLVSKNPQKLRNSGSDCFVNCAVQLFLISARNQLASVTSNQPIIQELQRLASRETDSVATLRRFLSNVNSRTEQGDVADVVNDILSILPDNILKLFKVFKKTKWRCNSCRDEKSRQVEHSEFERILTESTSFEQLMNLKPKTQLCKLCSAGESTKTTNVEVPPDLSHLLIHISKTREGVHILKLNVADQVLLFKRNWRFKAFCEYIPAIGRPYGSSGHYVTWMRSNVCWHRISDSHIDDDVAFPSDNKDIIYILLERCIE